jgi:hypothetical protein
LFEIPPKISKQRGVNKTLPENMVFVKVYPKIYDIKIKYLIQQTVKEIPHETCAILPQKDILQNMGEFIKDNLTAEEVKN